MCQYENTIFLKGWELAEWHVRVIARTTLVGCVSSHITHIALQGSGLHLGSLAVRMGKGQIERSSWELNQQSLALLSCSFTPPIVVSLLLFHRQETSILSLWVISFIEN